ncbi:hypothetical protein NQ315_004486 [Exocentrus adspersus]|uniref:C2H2-type domain-containing protein n=1 Tax=Exocentrus adspersus TaxID=1586481 RepID=A0AAV8VPM4_9CUCU|nr:hypothetical protein NQ315_004486 [Exocentrus adspersus]
MSKKPKGIVTVYPKYLKTKTLYLNENIHILCNQNEIIIGDEKSKIDMQFSFEEHSNDSKSHFTPYRDANSNIIPNKLTKLDQIGLRNKMKVCNNSSPSASSEASTESLQIPKRKIRRRKDPLPKTKHYRIDITKLKDQQTLNEKSGEFYICHCREKYNGYRPTFQKSDLRIITSDTESCSDTSKFMPKEEGKYFCNKCGNGYSKKQDLANHMQIHETFCRLCNQFFPNEYIFREHMRLHIFKVYMCHVCGREFPFRDLLEVHFECHIEDRTFETVLDMEEEYRIRRYNFMNMNYNSSINNILCYLNESRDYYCYHMFMKVICEVCYLEVFFCDYEQHLQSAHNHLYTS